MKILFSLILVLNSLFTLGQDIPGYYSSLWLHGEDIWLKPDSSYEIIHRSCLRGSNVLKPTKAEEKAALENKQKYKWVFRNDSLFISEYYDGDYSTFYFPSKNRNKFTDGNNTFYKTLWYYPEGTAKKVYKNPKFTPQDSLMSGTITLYARNGPPYITYEVQNEKKHGYEEMFFLDSNATYSSMKKDLLERGVSEESIKNILTFLDIYQWRILFPNCVHNGNWISGKKDGKWRYYHLNGEIKKIEIYDNGTPIKRWKYYNKRGKLIIEKFYNKKGELRKTKNY